MARFLIAALLLGVAPFARAQDTTLSQILIDGEGWKKAEGRAVKPKTVDPLEVLGAGVWDGQAPTVAVRSPDGRAVFVGFGAGLAVWAYSADGDADLATAAP
ncbi:hypothetical protein R5W24_005925 [Gemmata sp. JC717]|uniref:hypothetical protein n=1 Tax=Gemmata algarum TaxID=2975278 RepID=UPI0021BAD60D|nr:hypothetical protein [Gemmata algarum]MDY3556755.1 hypothetical protein [Gemmata algarum]